MTKNNKTKKDEEVELQENKVDLDEEQLALSEEEAQEELEEEEAEPEQEEGVEEALVTVAKDESEEEEESILLSLSLKSQIEALIFASPKPISLGELSELLAENFSSDEVEETLENLVLEYKEKDSGFYIELTATGEYQFRTKSEFSVLMEKLFSSKPRTLSRAAQETLAIIAYRQPVTRADIEFIRGVDAGSIIKNLLERDLVKCVGRKEEVGRPMLFGTTQQFLRVFQISKISDLPPLESFQPSKEVMNTAQEKTPGQSSDSVL